MLLQMNPRQKLAIAACVILLILEIPIPYLASPEWTVVVTDESARPLTGMPVLLSYENYSVEDHDHEIDLLTDSNGRVIFPAQKRKALILSRCYYSARSAMALALASFGPNASVLVFGNGREGSVNSPDGTVYFWKGQPDRVASTIVARPRE
jgi:hypothetical protein